MNARSSFAVLCGLTLAWGAGAKLNWIQGAFDPVTRLWVPGHFSNEQVELPQTPRLIGAWKDAYGTIADDGTLEVPATNIEFRIDELNGQHKRHGNPVKIRWAALKFTHHTWQGVSTVAEVGAGVVTRDPRGVVGGLSPNRSKGDEKVIKFTEQEEWLMKRLVVENAVLFSSDQHYLGGFNRSQDPWGWLGNPKGARGSTAAYGSAFSDFGPYGSLVSNNSSSNPNAGSPPRIVVVDPDGKPQIIGYVTTNEHLSGGYKLHPNTVAEWLRTH